MREMIEETLNVYQNLSDMALAEEQAEADAAAVRRIKKYLKPIPNNTNNKAKIYDARAKQNDSLANTEPTKKRLSEAPNLSKETDT
jgi:acetyl-CoA carboxylase carboxyltransferase component